MVEPCITPLSGDFEVTDALLKGLVELLRDAIQDGASVGFLATASDELIADYWRNCFRAAAAGERILFLAGQGQWVAGTVQLVFASQQNAPHRAEVQRLIVHRHARRAGVGRQLMLALEDEAKRCGRRLLFLNTRRGDPPEQMYRRLGYQSVGIIPAFALNPDGTSNDTAIMFKLM